MTEGGITGRFIKSFTVKWDRLAAEASAGTSIDRHELTGVERKLATLAEATADCLGSSGSARSLRRSVSPASGQPRRTGPVHRTFLTGS
jgi:hypothetical protein